MAALASDICGRVAAAEFYLLQQQTSEGLWPDFALEPGASEAWTTAVVAYALAQPPVGPGCAAAVRCAADRLHQIGTRDGWGYNRTTAVDADSTAWVLRLLTHLDDLRGLDGASILRGFLDTRGDAHTFRGVRFGRWSGAHSDVTPTVGLALRSIGAPRRIVEQTRLASLHALDEAPPWRAFWWTTHAYAVARNLEFLAVSGGVPQRAATPVRTWLASSVVQASGFERAQLLTCTLLVAPELASDYAGSLLELQDPGGSWPASAVLRLPSQRAPARAVGFSEQRGYFTTAMSLLALKQYLCAVPAESVAET